MFFFNDTAPAEIYTLSLHDALPICARGLVVGQIEHGRFDRSRFRGLRQTLYHRLEECSLVERHDEHGARRRSVHEEDRKSTRLNSSHMSISYAVFCLKKKTTNHTQS